MNVKQITAFLVATLATAHVAAAEPYEWAGGSVFREYIYNSEAVDTGKAPRKHFSEIDPGSKRTEMAELKANPRAPRLMTLSTKGVERAELLPEYWSGHSGTTAWLQVNRRPWVPLPRPAGTPGPAEHYYHTVLGSRAVPVALKDLIDGENTFRFTAGPQVWGSFDWGFYWIYAFTLRLYHPRAAEHPTASIANVKSGDALGENPPITVAVQPGGAPIKRVDVFAYYEDCNYSGSGFHREWHGQTIYGRPHQHVGSATAAPWTVHWNTEWVADQSQPIRLAARVVDEAGWHTVTPIVENVRFSPRARKVTLIRASEMPPGFGVRAGREMTCVLDVPSLPKKPAHARIKLLTWSGSHVERIRLNGVQLSPKIGREHDFSIDTIEVPPEAVKLGRNEFAMFSATTHHAAEVDWPGPVLLLEFGEK
ncbi:MAG: hypothetical protein Q7S40_25855 [Opitutaceae bacterium]|nr:hypothetical protein [Opitutaceae bacterium]